MRSLPLRIIVFGGVLILVAGVAWAVPADETRPSFVTAESGVAGSPDLDLPRLTDDAAREVTPLAAAAHATSTVPTTVHPSVVPAGAEHLETGEPLTTSEPAAVVTTTSAPPARVAPTPTAPLVTVAFTATQTYGSCGEDVPYDIFSGWATPGTTVSISSPYGSASTTVGAGGHWERKVEFPSAPRGETFSVTATGLGGSATLLFTATGSA